MTYTECARIATGHYRVRATSDEVKRLDADKWQLLDPMGDEVGIFVDKAQAVAYSKERPVAERLAETNMPPMQPKTFEQLAQVLNAIRPPKPGHHYLVIEVSDALTR